MSQKSTVAGLGVGLAVGGALAFAFMKWKDGKAAAGDEEPPPVVFLDSVPSE